MGLLPYIELGIFEDIFFLSIRVGFFSFSLKLCLFNMYFTKNLKFLIF